MGKLTQSEYKRKWARENADRLKRQKSEYYSANKEEILKRAKARYHHNPKKHSDRVRARKIEKNFGITAAQYDLMSLGQGHACKICGGVPTGSSRPLTVDHCHSTGRVRGLLCHSCNSAIGFFKENALFVARAVSYLQG